MFCSRCGNIVGETERFCSKCGNWLNPNSAYVPTQHPRTSNNTTKKSNSGKIITVSVVAIALLAIVFIALVDYEPEEEDIFEVQIIDNDSYFELRGDFLEERGKLIVELDDKGGINFTINSEYVMADYTNFVWNFFDADAPASASKTKFTEYKGTSSNVKEPILRCPDLDAGDYRISVSCYTTADGVSKRVSTFSGSVVYVDSIVKEYNWSYLGSKYSVKVSFDYDDYRTYKQMKPNGRHVTYYPSSTSFVTFEDRTIISLAESLRTAYGKNAELDQSLAAFVLSFVQICFEYPPYTTGLTSMTADMYLFGQSEYFAYPLETIFHGMGDCEDTSLLAAALYKALGFEAGIVLIPGHAVAAVGLDVYSPGTYFGYGYEILSKKIDGITYYVCETTVDAFQQIGLISSTGYDGHKYSYYIGKDGYGFYIA